MSNNLSTTMPPEKVLRLREIVREGRAALGEWRVAKLNYERAKIIWDAVEKLRALDEEL